MEKSTGWSSFWHYTDAIKLVRAALLHELSLEPSEAVVEATARAIYEAQRSPHYAHWDKIGRSEQVARFDDARAALKACNAKRKMEIENG